VSTWRRAPDVALPCRIKASTNYQVARLALIEGRPMGYHEMVLLNPEGRVAETTRTSLFIVRDGRVMTPPSWEGTLESITIDIVEELCADLEIPFERRPVELTELHIAEEVTLAGTITELTHVGAVAGRRLGEPVVTERLLRRYRDAVTGVHPHPSVDLSCRTFEPRTALVAGA
jgi:branched-chain amino acid aminotransferase